MNKEGNQLRFDLWDRQTYLWSTLRVSILSVVLITMTNSSLAADSTIVKLDSPLTASTIQSLEKGTAKL